MKFFTFFDKTFGDEKSGPCEVTFRHDFDANSKKKILDRVELWGRSVLIGSYEPIKEDCLWGNKTFVTTTGNISLTLFQDEIKSMKKIEVFENEIIGQTTCYIYCPKTKSYFSGTAYCGNEDQFSRRTGRAISFGRAIMSMFPCSKDSVTPNDFRVAEVWTGFMARNYGIYINCHDIIDEELAGINKMFPEYRYVHSAMASCLR